MRLLPRTANATGVTQSAKIPLRAFFHLFWYTAPTFSKKMLRMKLPQRSSAFQRKASKLKYCNETAENHFLVQHNYQNKAKMYKFWGWLFKHGAEYQGEIACLPVQVALWWVKVTFGFPFFSLVDSPGSDFTNKAPSVGSSAKLLQLDAHSAQRSTQEEVPYFVSSNLTRITCFLMN